MLPKVSVYTKRIKYMPVLIKDGGLLKKCNKIWDKVDNNVKKEFVSEPLFLFRTLSNISNEIFCDDS